MSIVDKVDSAFLFIFTVSVIILALVTFFMIFFIIKYHRSRHPNAVQIEGNIYLETAWIVIPTILVMFMFYYGWTGFKLMRSIPENALKIKVTARMWSWTFEYPNGAVSNILRVPVGEPVRVEIHSIDVLHSFFIPAFRIKEDAVPGQTTHAWFEPESVGKFDIFCAEYCGVAHSQMLSKVIVLPRTAFNQWYRQADPKAVKNDPVAAGELIYRTKGCAACHSTDGTKRIGPTFKGLFGDKTYIITNGEEREITADKEYIIKSIKTPAADLVKGYNNLMPPQGNALTDEEIEQLIEYLKTL